MTIFKLLFLFLTIQTYSTFAAVNGNIRVTGIIPIFNDISLAPYPQASNLNILNGENSTLVAEVIEVSNNTEGFNIQVSSQNGGKLINSLLPTAAINYQLSYDGSNFFTPQSGHLPSTAKIVWLLDKKTSHLSSVKIRFLGQSNSPYGNYEDTLTFSIVTN